MFPIDIFPFGLVVRWCMLGFAIVAVLLLLAGCGDPHALKYVSPNAPMWEIAPQPPPAARQAAR